MTSFFKHSHHLLFCTIKILCFSRLGAQSDSEVSTSTTYADSVDRGYTSDTELHSSTSTSKLSAEDTSSWQVVNREDLLNGRAQPPSGVNQYDIALTEELKYHDSKALLKCCETLAFLVRDAAHVTPHNFESCVHCLRTFIEASINGGGCAEPNLGLFSLKTVGRGGGKCIPHKPLCVFWRGLIVAFFTLHVVMNKICLNQTLVER